MPNKTSITFIGYSPQRAATVFGNNHRAVVGDCHSYGPTPDLFIANHKTCHEVLILAGSHAIVYDYSDYFVAGLASAIPRAVRCDKGITLILPRKLSTI